MRKCALILAAVMFSSAILAAQTQNSPPPTLGPPPGQNGPTLGAAPRLGGPSTFTVTNPAKLRTIKTVYIGWMDDRLNVKLLTDFSKDGPFRVVSDRRKADAILQGTCFDSPHLKEVHSEVFLTGQDGKSIWQDVIHQPYHPPSLNQAVSETANLIVAHLKRSIEVSNRR